MYACNLEGISGVFEDLIAWPSHFLLVEFSTNIHRQVMDILKRENESLRLEVEYYRGKFLEVWHHHSSHHAGCPISLLTPPPSSRGSDEALDDASSIDRSEAHTQKRPRPCKESGDQPAAGGALFARSAATSELRDGTGGSGTWKISPKKPTKLPRWRPLADRLINQTPVAKNWWTRVDSMELGDILQGGSGIEFLLDKDSSLLRFPASENLESCSADANGPDMDEGRLIPVVNEYAQITAARSRTVGSTLRVLNIQKFIVVCLCAVVSKVLPSKRHQKMLYDITRICFGKNITEIYIRRLWATGVYLNEFIDWLASQGWGPRAALLLLICKIRCRKTKFALTADRGSASK
jgi:hypothetical protein